MNVTLNLCLAFGWQGDAAFWMGVVEGVETTRKLEQPIVAKF